MIMNEQQFNILLKTLHECKNQIIEKLEEVRTGNIDIENATLKAIIVLLKGKA